MVPRTRGTPRRSPIACPGGHWVWNCLSGRKLHRPGTGGGFGRRWSPPGDQRGRAVACGQTAHRAGEAIDDLRNMWNPDNRLRGSGRLLATVGRNRRMPGLPRRQRRLRQASAIIRPRLRLGLTCPFGNAAAARSKTITADCRQHPVEGSSSASAALRRASIRQRDDVWG